MKKKIFAAAIAVIIMISAVPFAAFAENEAGDKISGSISAGKTELLDLDFDFSVFADADNTVYNKSIAELAILLSIDANRNMFGTETFGSALSVSLGGRDAPLLESLGFDAEYFELADENYETDKNDITSFFCGRREIAGGRKVIYAVTFMGSDLGAEQWRSNFDIGADTDAYFSVLGEKRKWSNMKNHKGFDVTANRSIEVFTKYMNKYESADKGKEICYLITGHSRGGAIANIMGSIFENENRRSFTYTFASPGTTTDKGDYKTVFNLINEDDIVPYLPLKSWGFMRYGRDYSFSVAESFAKNEDGEDTETKYYYDIIGSEYKGTPNADPDTESKLRRLASSREELYEFDEKIYKIPEKSASFIIFGRRQDIKEALSEYGLSSYLKIISTENGYHNAYICPAFVLQCIPSLIGGGTVPITILTNIASSEKEDGNYTEGKYSVALKYLASSAMNLLSGHDYFAYYMIALNNDPAPLTEEPTQSPTISPFIFIYLAAGIFCIAAGIIIGLVIAKAINKRNQ